MSPPRNTKEHRRLAWAGVVSALVCGVIATVLLLADEPFTAAGFIIGAMLSLLFAVALDPFL